MSMANVKIKLFATLRDKYRRKEIDVSCDGTFEGLIKGAARQLGKGFIRDVYDLEGGKFRDDRIVTINGRNVKDMKRKPRLKDGDEVAVFPPIGGGKTD